MHTKKTILYVDDYADNRSLLQRILESEGFSVIQAPDGTRALQLLTESPLDLALIDLHLPDTNGYALGEKVRQFPKHHQLPIIYVTAGDHEPIEGKSASSPFDTFIQKPFELDSLLREIRLQLGLSPGKS